MITRPKSCLLALALALTPCAAEAGFPGNVPDTFQVSAGLTVDSLSSTSGITSAEHGIGTIVSFEDLVNLPASQSTLRVDGFWHVSKRSYIDFGWVQFNRSGSAQANQDIAWGDYTFKANSRLDGKFDTSFTYAAYRYDFLQHDDVRISGSAGVSYVHLAAALGATGEVIGPDGPIAGTLSAEASVNVPVPLVGIQLDWALSNRLALSSHARVFYLNLSKVSGGMSDTGVRLNWWFSDHVAIGLGTSSISLDLRNYESGNKKYKFGYVARGLDLMLTAAF